MRKVKAAKRKILLRRKVCDAYSLYDSDKLVGTETFLYDDEKNHGSMTLNPIKIYQIQSNDIILLSFHIIPALLKN